MNDLALFLYRHPIVRYLMVGGTTFALDFAILYVLHSTLALNLAASTSVAYWISIFYNFTLNRYWTFSTREKEDLRRHMTAYFALLVFNFLFTVTFVSIVGEYVNFVLAKSLAVGIQMIWTYYLYKTQIFTSK